MQTNLCYYPKAKEKKRIKKQAIVSELNLHIKQYIEPNNVHFFACNSFIGLNYKWNEKYIAHLRIYSN